MSQRCFLDFSQGHLDIFLFEKSTVIIIPTVEVKDQILQIIILDV